MKLKHINAEVTRACNLACDYCFNASGKRMPDELSLNDWKNIIRMSKASGAESALFTGGELMTRKDSPEIVQYSIDTGLKTSILSNGFNLKELNCQYLDRVQISLDSASPIAHDMRRGNGSWLVARKAIDFARAFGTNVEISTTISLDRLDELEGLAGVAYSSGSKLLLRPIQQIGRADGRFTTLEESAFTDRMGHLKYKFGKIFVEDFAKYVPVLGMNHDRTVMKEGYFTFLPNGFVRGTNQRAEALLSGLN
jgi:MoaA/NifB/PqqE/SkfB family radical SAM enzyme